MARVNISISEELKESMEGLNCNWSAIAQAAFSLAVEIENFKNQGKNMEAGILRLRAEKRMDSEREDALGFLHGKNWALEDATYSDLEKIVDLFKFAQDSENMEAALQYLNQTLDKNSFDIEGMPKHDISVKYALAFYESVLEVFEKI